MRSIHSFRSASPHSFRSSMPHCLANPFLRHHVGGDVLNCLAPLASKCLRGGSRFQVSWVQARLSVGPRSAVVSFEHIVMDLPLEIPPIFRGGDRMKAKAFLASAAVFIGGCSANTNVSSSDLTARGGGRGCRQQRLRRWILPPTPYRLRRRVGPILRPVLQSNLAMP